MKVSVIINNYNYARFLREAIESVLSQTYPQIECIVVDDGSTDESREIIRWYGERIRPVFKANGGQASAFNAGFAVAKGEIVCFLDADDYYGPTAIERVVKNWKDDTNILYHRLYAVDAGGKTFGCIPPDSNALAFGDIKPELLAEGSYCVPPTTGQAYRRTLLEKILPIDEPRWRICADLPIMIEGPFLSQVSVMDELVAYYRVHGANSYNSLEIEGVVTRRTLTASDLKRALFGLLRSDLVKEVAVKYGFPEPRFVSSGISFPKLLLHRAQAPGYRFVELAVLYASLMEALFTEKRKSWRYIVQKSVAGFVIWLAPRPVLGRIYPKLFENGQ